VDQCFETIRNQTYKDFDVFELDYGGTNRQAYKGSNFESKPLANHAEAHNYLLDKVFSMDYDCAFNTNIDDYYSYNRFEEQIPWIERAYDVVSSNFVRFTEGKIGFHYLNFAGMDYVKEAAKGHNIMAHPVLCYSRHFWLNCDKLNPKLIPFDDFECWKSAYKKGFKFIILQDYLLYQRVHNNNVSKKR